MTVSILTACQNVVRARLLADPKPSGDTCDDALRRASARAALEAADAQFAKVCTPEAVLRLWVALEAFAVRANAYEGDEPLRGFPTMRTPDDKIIGAEAQLTAGDLRRARAALQSPEAETTS